MTGIYQIQSKIKPDRIYIGSSANIDKRWKEHKNDLRAKRHKSTKLQRHFNKYGENDFIYLIIKECEINKLIEIEQYYIDTLTPYFNINKIANSPLGLKRSQETKNKISKKNKGKWGNRKGIKMSEKSKEKARITRKNNIILKHKEPGFIYVPQKEQIIINRKNRLILKQKKESEKIKLSQNKIRKRRKVMTYSSQYKGVHVRYIKYKCIITKKITSSIAYNNKLLGLGTFKTEEDAARAYDKKAKELFGNLAILNFNNKT